MAEEVKEVFESDSLEPLLPAYYKRLFPTHLFSRWLAHGEPAATTSFKNREFAFTLGNDVFCRYQSFSDHQDLERELIKVKPHKLHVGAVFTTKPKNNHVFRNSLMPIQKEFVLDVDISDYDDVRYCCSGADVCNSCWTLMSIAIDILDKCLEDDFGFAHRLWVFSGRRGIHCWVCDKEARHLTNAARDAIVSYLSLVPKDNHDGKSSFVSNNLHPSLQRAAEIIERRFVEYACIQQDFLGNAAQMSKVLKMCPGEDRSSIEEIWSECDDSHSRWIALCNHFTASKKKYRQKDRNPHVVTDIMFYFCYPRIDANVSKMMNHLLKCPFSVHPKTGKVSVPIPPHDYANFRVKDVPTITELVEQIKTSNEADASVKNFRHSKLQPCIEYFESFVRHMSYDTNEKKLQESDIRGLSGEF